MGEFHFVQCYDACAFLYNGEYDTLVVKGTFYEDDATSFNPSVFFVQVQYNLTTGSYFASDGVLDLTHIFDSYQFKQMDGKIAALETSQTQQDAKITALETADARQDTKIAALETASSRRPTPGRTRR